MLPQNFGVMPDSALQSLVSCAYMFRVFALSFFRCKSAPRLLLPSLLLFFEQCVQVIFQGTSWFRSGFSA